MLPTPAIIPEYSPDTVLIKPDKPIEKVKETPIETKKVAHVPKEDFANQEVALLQNEGIFRRELLITLKELVDVKKISTQALLDLRDMIGGEYDNTKK